jgi:hypothetical protein
MGVKAWRFALGVLGAEAVPVLGLVVAMFFVGNELGRQPDQATAEAWGAWIGPIGGLVASGFVGRILARSSNRPIHAGIAFGIALAVFDLSLTLLATQGSPFKLLYVISALARLAGGALGGVAAARRTGPPA